MNYHQEAIYRRLSELKDRGVEHPTLYGRRWRDRDGSISSVDLCESEEELGLKCRSFGWPGHDGARWRYWLDDIHSLFKRFRP